MVLSARGTRTRENDTGRAPAGEKAARKAEKRTPLKKISAAEAEMARISEIISKIDAALALPDLFQRDPKQAAQLGKARAGAATALQRAEQAWLDASTEQEG
jgi:ATP-binding cassette subfamily F protein 3